MTQNWIPLTEYSSKYRVSISTLRRRIKAEDISYEFRDGKYFIFEEAQKSVHPVARENAAVKSSGFAGRNVVENNRPSRSFVQRPSLDNMDRTSEQAVGVVSNGTATSAPAVCAPLQEEPILTAANRLLTELKKAYSQILHEKEDQILNLRAENSDLKTLVRVLESENERLQKFRNF